MRMNRYLLGCLGVVLACCGTPEQTPATNGATTTVSIPTTTTTVPSTTSTLPATTTTTTIPVTTTEAPTKEAHEVELARDLPSYRRGEIPIDGLTDTALEPILTSPLPLILPRTLPGSDVWSLDASRVFTSEDASGEVILYTYFLVADGDLELAVDVGAVSEDAEGPRVADYAPRAPEAGMAAGLVPYRLDSLDSVRFILHASDLALTIEFFRLCPREEDWTIGRGICLTWEDIGGIVTTMGVVEP